MNENEKNKDLENIVNGALAEWVLRKMYNTDQSVLVAKRVIEAGYRKVADDEMVLKQSEVDEFRKDHAEVKFLKNKIKQETAREILQELNDEGYKIYKQQGDTFNAGNFNWLIAYTMQKYGIGLEDNNER